MSLFAVYVRPPLNQTWADGSPVLWSATVEARSEAEARRMAANSPIFKGMPIVGSYRK
jgi:hypothetical protein